MKKTRFLALTLVVAIMLMGAGYAFWMESIEIGSTVNTGKLDIKFSNDSAFLGGGNYVTDNQNGHYVNGSAIVNGDDNKLDIILDNMHPGSYAKFKFCMENTGTIDLYVTDFEFIGNDNDNLKQLGVLKEDKTIVPVAEYLKTINDIAIAKEAKGDMEITFAILKCANDDNFEENTQFGFSIKANARQYNDDRSCDPKENPQDPVINGLKFVKTNEWDSGSGRKISGKVYYTWSQDKEDTYAGELTSSSMKKGESWTSGNYSGYKLKFTRSLLGDITWEVIQN